MSAAELDIGILESPPRHHVQAFKRQGLICGAKPRPLGLDPAFPLISIDALG